MASNSRDKAVKGFSTTIQRALSCFATGKVFGDTYDLGVIGRLSLNGAKKVQLRGPGRLRISLSILYEVLQVGDPLRPEFDVSTRGYMHHLYSSAGDELIGYHWHPIDNSHATWPHLHVTGGKNHYPSGRILVEDVLQLAMEYGATPTDPKAWRRVSKANRERFASEATWHSYVPSD